MQAWDPSTAVAKGCPCSAVAEVVIAEQFVEEVHWKDDSPLVMR